MRLALTTTPVLGLALLAGLSGCQTPGAVTNLPDPIFPTPRVIPPSPPPPAPVVVQPPAPPPRVAPRGEPGWTPAGGRLSPRWTCVVIHHSGSASGGAVAFDQNHRNVRKWDELGYHFVIGNGTHTADGQVEVGSRWAKQKHGAHCKTPDNYYNDHGIGICLVGDFSRRSPSPAQMASLARLIQFLMAESKLPASKVFTHGGVTHRTACPGAKFPLASLKGRLNLVVAAGGSAGQ